MTPKTTPKSPAASRRQPEAPPVGDPGFDSIRTLAASLQELHRQMVKSSEPIVQSIIQFRSRDVQEIEQALDRLLDCACIPEGLNLFKALCRYYYNINPVATASYVHAYRELWDNEADQEQEVAS